MEVHVHETNQKLQSIIQVNRDIVLTVADSESTSSKLLANNPHHACSRHASPKTRLSNQATAQVGAIRNTLKQARLNGILQ